MCRKATAVLLVLMVGCVLAGADDGLGPGCAAEGDVGRSVARVQELEERILHLLCLATEGTLPTDSDLRSLRAEVDRLRSEEGLADKGRALRPLVTELDRAARRQATPAVPAGACGPGRGVGVGRRGGEDAPPNDSCAAATVIGQGTFSGTTSEATNDGQASCGASMFSPDVWFRFVAPAAGVVGADTFGSGFDTVLSVHTGCPGTVANQIACNDDAWGLDSAVALTVDVGQEVLIRVSGYGGATGDYVLRVGPTAAVSGYVFNSGAPLESVPVRVFSADGGFVGSTVSDSTGAYTVGGLVGGTVFVGTGLGSLEYVDELYDDILCPGGAPSGCDPTSGTPVSVMPGSVTPGIDFELARGGAIAGWVRRTADNAPIGGAAVSVFDQSGNVVGAATSSTSAPWTVGGLLPGDYFVVASHPWYLDELYEDHPCEGGCDPLDGDPIHVSLSGTTFVFQFLDQLGSLSGRLTEVATGMPLAGDWVEVYDPGGGWVAGTSVDTDGDYLVGGLGTGSYFVRTSTWHHADELYDDVPCEPDCMVTAGTPVAVTVGQTTPGVAFQLVQLGRLAGLVTEVGSGSPISGAWVTAHDSLGFYRGGAATGSDGSYLVPDLAAGTYFVRTDASWLGFADELYDGLPCYLGCQVTTGTPVGVVNGAIVGGVDFALSQLGAITGTVTDEGTGAPLEGVQVEVWAGQGRQEVVVTDAAGEFTLERLVPRDYFVVTNGTGPYLDELFHEIPCPGGPETGCAPTNGTAVSVTLATTSSGVDFTLERGAVISGVITAAADGGPLAGVSVSVPDWYGVEHGLGQSLVDGSYQVEGLPEGGYYALASLYGHGTVLFDGVLCPEWPGPPCDYQIQGTIITAVAGTTVTGVDFTLGRLGAFSGVVVDSLTGNPAPGVGVRVYAADGSSGGEAWTDPQGLYLLDRLYPGSYFAVARGAGLSPEVFDNRPCPLGVCVPTAGNPIAVALDQVSRHVDFSLDPTGAISGRVTDEVTGLPLTQGQVAIWGLTGTWISSQYLGSSGEYRAENLLPGLYFVTTGVGSSRLDELYDDFPCLGGAPDGCDPTKGTPVAVPSGGTASGVDFALAFRDSGIAGSVRSASTGEPVGGVRVDVWRASNRELVRSTTTSGIGAYLVPVSPDTYLVSTDNGLGLVDEVFEDHQCWFGSVLAGTCDVGQGDDVTVTASELTTGVDFVLRGVALFGDGFESGTMSAWSGVVP